MVFAALGGSRQRMNLPDRQRVNVMIQFVSHVLPASFEYACSQRAEVRVICDHVIRARVGVPLTKVSA